MTKETNFRVLTVLRENSVLLFSMIAALCLFVTPSLLGAVLCIIAFFAAVMVCVWFDVKHVRKQWTGFVKSGAAILVTILLESMGLSSFFSTWLPSRKVAALASILHLSTRGLLTLTGAAGCAVGAYALYVFSAFVIEKATGLLKERLPIKNKKEAVANIKANWFFLLSTAAFFCLHSNLTVGYLLGLLIALACTVVVSSQVPSVRKYASLKAVPLKVFSALTATGICLCGLKIFRSDWSVSSKVQALNAALPGSLDILFVVGVFGAVIGLYFVYVCLLFFWTELKKAVEGTSLTDGVRKSEIFVYAVLVLTAAVFVSVVFSKTQAFYGTEASYDVIYTSDSPSLLKGYAWVSLLNEENDLRQPLFAVFSAPFMGFIYLLVEILPILASTKAILLDYVQIILFFFANYLLARTMKLDAVKRICFMIFFCGTYTWPLFLLMMEQYIVAYFWLMLCVYLIAEKRRCPGLALYGAGGTLLTSLVLLAADSGERPTRGLKEWIAGMANRGLEFFALMLAFCRFDVIYCLTSKISSLMGFAGGSVSLKVRLFQYTAFVRSCFLAPDAGLNVSEKGLISWRQMPTNSVDLFGVAMLSLVIVSLWVNRKKISSRVAGGWVAFSAVMLILLGWGTAENGLILYALYFGWGFCMLIYQLIEAAGKRIKVKVLAPVCGIVAAIAMSLYNIPAIAEMVRFAIAYYPV
ncbi:MAG: hypothetical protein LUE29_11050 [Lachnospiraceae bacterium]|nr:hypothetical protein [Lachnospiraceae bacterium]